MWLAVKPRDALSPSLGSTGGLDATAVLTVYLVALFAIPSRFVIGPLGGAGTPAGVLGLGCLLWWIYYQVQRPDPTGAGSQPIRTALFVASGAVFVSFVVAMSRPIDGIEASSANLGVVAWMGWAGVLLVANDGISDPVRLTRLTHRMVLAGGAIATLGIVQFLTGRSWIDEISVPGLSVNAALSDLANRAGFNRPAGTANHPIEFGAVITMLLPLAITLARTDLSRGLVRKWYPVAVMSLAIPISISRSALVSAVTGVLVLAIAWPSSTRRAALAWVATLVFLVALAIPGMLGTLLNLFTAIGGDSSAQSRTGSYAIAFQFIERAPVFGRGFGTFLPAYRILDNQYLLLLIEVGLVGLVAVLTLIATGVVCGQRARSRSRDEPSRQLAQALTAAIGAAACGLAVYDGFSFPMASGLFFLVLGVTGAHARLVREPNPR